METKFAIYREKDGAPLLVFPNEKATKNGDVLAFSMTDGHTTATKKYLRTLTKLSKDDSEARKIVETYNANYKTALNFEA